MVIVWISVGVLLYLCVNHMLLFLGRKKDLSNLAYSLLCFMFIFITLVFHVYPETDFYNQYHYYILVVGTAVFLAVFSAFFAHTVFDLREIKWYTVPCVILFFVSVLVFSPLYLVTHNPIYMQSMFIILLLGGVTFIVMLVAMIIRKKQYRDRKRRLILIGYLIVFIDGMLFLAFEAFFFRVPLSAFSRLAVLSMALIFSYALTDSFNREHKDLLELKDSLEQKVHERTAQLKETHRQKTAFFINLAHETKTPVTLISNYLDAYIKKMGVSSETKVIKHNIEKLLRDIVNILDMEKLETGITFYDHDQILNLTHIVSQKVLFYKELARKKNIGITARSSGHITLRVDPYAIDRILNNLIDNALRYNRAGGSVEVRLKNKVLEDKIEISVKDTGIGISRKKLKHIFDPFYQISREKKNYQGLGLGLSIVKRIADEIGAEVRVRSERGKGTEFTISLTRYVPSKHDKVMKRVKVSKPTDTFANMGELGNIEGEQKEGRHNVLVVEDNVEMLTFLRDNIGRKYNFYGAVNGRQALDMLADIPRPHLIISDIMMDVMDGYEFYESVTRNRIFKSVPFIFLTAKTSRYQQLKGLTSGVVDYITKPFSIDVLMAKIHSIIRNQEQQKEVILKQIGMDLYRFLSEKALSVSVNAEAYMGKKEQLEDTLKKLRLYANQASRDQGLADGNAPDVLYKLETEYGISRREMEIIRLIREGLLYKEIATILNISANTVETYRKRIFKKCNVQNKIELLKIFGKK